jgi:hypothetical protein
MYIYKQNDEDLPSGILETIASGMIQMPLLYNGRLVQSRLSGHETLYRSIRGSHPLLASSQTLRQGGIASCENSTVHIGAYIEQRKNSNELLHWVSTNCSNCSIAKMAFFCVLWCSRFGILVMLYRIRSHMGIWIGSH